MKKRIGSLLLCLVMVFCLFPVTAKAVTVIDRVSVGGIDYPTAGYEPDTTAHVNGSGYSINSIEWYDRTSQEYISDFNLIVREHAYDVIVWLEAEEGYEFKTKDSKTHDLVASINNIWVSSTKAYEYNAWAMVELRLSFPEIPRYGWIRSVDLHPIDPQVGYPIEFYEISRNEYKGVSRNGAENYTRFGSRWWCDGNAVPATEKVYFQAGSSYTYGASIQPRDGYAFVHVPSVTVDGYPVPYTFEWEEGVGQIMCVEFGYDALTMTGISSVELNIPAPVTGEHPAYDQITDAAYQSIDAAYSGQGKNGITWYEVNGTPLSPGSGMTFEGGKEYEVSVCLAPNPGYMFLETCRATVNGVPADVSMYGDMLLVEILFPATEPDHEHSPSEWRTTQVYHYKVCTTCGEFLEDQDHMGGTANCVEKAKCSVCNMYYGETDSEHRWGPGWDYKDSSGHAWVCADCRTHSTITPHSPGPAATADAPQKCMVCDYIISPAVNHSHALNKVEAKAAGCLFDGNMEYYRCSGCEDWFRDAGGKEKIENKDSVILSALGHFTEDKYIYDMENHWQGCKICGISIDEAKLPHKDENGDGNCDACGYVIGSEIAPADGSLNPAEPGATADGEEEQSDKESSSAPEMQKEQHGSGGKGGWLTAVLIALVCFGAAVVTTVIVLKKKRK